MHGPQAPSPGRGQVPEDVVRRLEEHDDQQVRTCYEQSILARLTLPYTRNRQT